LSTKSACDIFYSIYKNGGQSDIVSGLVKRLDFHALSITLLATAASHNMWDYGRLADEWETQRAQILRTDHNESLAATIELSLASQTFLKLSSSPSPSPSQTYDKVITSAIPPKSAYSPREVLEVVAFFPQGVNENNLDWLFPTVPDRKNILDKFCLLSLTYRNNGFITMLAPIRDYLSPKDPKSSPLLRATKDRYFSRLSVDVAPGGPGFGEARWIVLEDINVEHLLDVSLSADPYADDISDACIHFMRHLYWHKPRRTTLELKIEPLRDNHPTSQDACSSSHGCAKRLGITRNENDSSSTPWSWKDSGGMTFRSLQCCYLYPMSIEFWVSSKKGYDRRMNLWKFSNGLVTQQDRLTL
jgi:hypothetical protein